MSLYDQAGDLLYEEDDCGKRRTDYLWLGRLLLATRAQDCDGSRDENGNGIPDCEELCAQGTGHAPVLDPIGDQRLHAGDTLDLLVTASDADGDDLAFTADGVPGFCSLTDHGDGTATLACTPGLGHDGAYPITLSVREDTGPALAASETFTLTVLAANRPPVLSSIGDHSVLVATLLEIPLTASDPDDDALAFTVTDAPAGASLTDHGDGSALFEWTPDASASGDHPVTFRVSDDGVPPASAEETLVIQVVTPGDLDGDGVIDADDFAAFLATMGACAGAPAFNALADYDGDGCISYVDYVTWLGYFYGQ